MREEATTDKTARENHIKIMVITKSGHTTVSTTTKVEITNAVKDRKVIFPDRVETIPDRKETTSDVIMVQDLKDRMIIHKDNHTAIRTIPTRKVTAP
jgi:hypothetical protein